jgi:ring-1,2-phenylacetyl-CoA epoxidase subunit PaaE
LKQALTTENGTRATLIYGNRRRHSTMFGGELEALKDLYLGRLEIIPILSADGEAETPLFQGRIDADKVHALATLVDYAGAERLFVCGPGDMIKTVRDALVALGVPRDRIVHEFFAPPGVARKSQPPRATAPSAAERSAHAVTVVVDGVRHRVGVASGETILDAALAAGIKAPHACRGGMCSTCRAKIVAGTVAMTLNYSLEPWELARGFVLACQAVPTSASVEIDFDAM